MGADIHLHIVHNNKILKKEIYKNRNSEWFDNMIGRYTTEPAYDYLPYDYDWECEGQCPQELIDEYLKESEDGVLPRWTYDERSIKVKDFLDWFIKYQPALKAGYVSKYDAWLYENKHIIPSSENLEHYLWADVKQRDFVWIEFTDPYEPSRWLFNYLKENEIPEDAWIVYCFDC